MTKHSIPIVAVFLLIMSAFHTAAYAADIPSDNRIKILRYDPNDIYTIYTLFGYQTNIEFDDGERIQTISVGDRSLWQIVPSAYRLFIRPLDDNMTTNMTVITDRRTYQFDLKSGKGELSDNPRMVYVARFTYPKKQVMAPKMPAPMAQQVVAPPPPMPAQQPAAPIKPMVTLPPPEPMKTVEFERFEPVPPPPSSQAVSLSRSSNTLNYDYTYTGPDELAPVQLYDDGRQTYMRLTNMGGVPPKLFAIDGGKQRQLDYQKQGEMLVTSSVHSYLLLDYGQGNNNRIYLYNEDRMPAGL